MSLNRISHSSLQEWKNCKQLYKLNKIDNIETKKRPVYFVFGSAISNFRDALYSGLSTEVSLRKIDEEFKKVDLALLTPEDTAKFHIEWARCLGMAVAYVKRYRDSDFDQYQKFLTEKWGEFEILPGIKYVGKPDVLKQDASGKWWVGETKTAQKSLVNENYFDRVRIDSQTLGYFYLAKEIVGEFPIGVVYDVLCKTQHRKTNKETIQQFCKRIKEMYEEHSDTEGLLERRELLVGQKDLDRWLTETKEEVRSLANMHDSSTTLWPKNDGYCQGKYGYCKYFFICTTGRIDPLVYQKKQGNEVVEIPPGDEE